MRPTLPALSLLGALVLLPACAAPSAPATAPSAADSASVRRAPPDDAIMQVVPLQHWRAQELAPVVADLLGSAGDDARVMADERLNALIVLASPEVHERMATLVEHLDVPTTR